MNDFWEKQAFPILLSTAVSVAILNTFSDLVLVFVMPALFASAITFYLCDYAKGQGARAPLFYLTGLVVTLFLAYIFVASDATGTNFLDWILANQLGSEGTSYFIAMFILCSFFISSGVFYFTSVIYRSAFLFMILAFPCLLYVRKHSKIPTVYIAVIITFYFIVMMLYGNKEFNNSAKRIMQSGYKKAVCFFGAIIFALTLGASFANVPDAVLPQNNKSKNVQIDNLLNYGQYSGTAGNGQNLDEILFLVDADEQLYLIRQVFGEYDGKRWKALNDRALLNGRYGWEENASSLNLDMLFEDIRLACADEGSAFASKYGNGIEDLKYIEQAKTAKITPQGYPSRYVLAPGRTFLVDGVSERIRYAQNPVGEIFVTSNGVMDAEKPYYVTYYSEAFRNNPAFQRYSGQFRFGEYGKLLTDLLTASASSDTRFNGVTVSFFLEYSNAKRYSNVSGTYSSGRLDALAVRITEGKTSEYEKAQAIERYFHENGYTYSTTYVPPRGSENIEYFVFDSKTGSCSQYATAMTLLARSCGLNARYVEGFTSYEKNSSGQYVVRARNSHAFTQVFIPVSGWVTFDATVADSGSENTSGGIQNILKNIIGGSKAPVAFTSLSGIILFALLCYVIYTFIISERIFRIKVAGSGGRDAIVLLYCKMVRTVYRKLGVFNITAETLAKTVSDKYNLDIRIVTDCFERVAFNNEDISKEDKQAALKAYYKFYSACRRKT